MHGAPLEIRTYPQLKQVANIRKLLPVTGVCSGASPFIWVVTEGSVIYKFPRGATKPSSHLTLAGSNFLTQCSVDRTTSDLAVVNNPPSGFTLVRWPHGSGQPVSFRLPFVGQSCSYDAKGNLYVAGAAAETNDFRLAELSKGSVGFQLLDISGMAKYSPGGIQWDGKYLAVQVTKGTDNQIDRISVEGLKAKIIQRITPDDLGQNVPIFITGDELIAVLQGPGSFGTGFWHYPAGGKPFQMIPFDGLSGITVSP